MTPYSSTSGKKSGVTAYEIGKDYITVKFDRNQYTYTESLNGKAVIEKMKSLAIASSGLSTYISRNRNTLNFI